MTDVVRSWISLNATSSYDFLGRPKPKNFSKNRPEVRILNHQYENRRDCVIFLPEGINSNGEALSVSKSKVERFFCAQLPNRAASPAPGSFDQASYQSFSELLPLPVVCSSLLTFVSCHSLKWRISKSQPQRPEQRNIRRRDVSLLRISEKASCATSGANLDSACAFELTRRVTERCCRSCRLCTHQRTD